MGLQSSAEPSLLFSLRRGMRDLLGGASLTTVVLVRGGEGGGGKEEGGEWDCTGR